MDLREQLSRQTGSGSVGLLLGLVAFVGAIAILQTALRAATGVYVYFLRPGKNLKKLGTWAVVTGATDGIGKAYAEALAKIGPSIDILPRL